jgi:hypothetical protein
MNEQNLFLIRVHGPIPTHILRQFLIRIPERVLPNVVLALPHFIPVIEHQLMCNQLRQNTSQLHIMQVGVVGDEGL